MNIIGYGVVTEGGKPVGIWPVPLQQALRARDRYSLTTRLPHDVVPVYVGTAVDRAMKVAPKVEPEELA